MIDFNITMLFQLVNFLVTMVVLNILLIKPIRENMKQRNDKMAGLLGESEQFSSQAEDKLKNYEAVLATARAEASAQRDVAKAAGVAREQEIVAAAAKEAQDYLIASRASVAAQVTKAMDDLKSQVGALAASATAKVLG